MQEKNEWKYPYQHLAERYYTIFKYLAESVHDSVNCLQGKNSIEIDDFHQKIVLSIANQ